MGVISGRDGEAIRSASDRCRAAAQQHQPRCGILDLIQIADANARGQRLIGQVSGCPLTMGFTLASSYPVGGLQACKPALGLQGDALRSVLTDKNVRQSVRAEIAAPTAFPPVQRGWDKNFETMKASACICSVIRFAT